MLSLQDVTDLIRTPNVLRIYLQLSVQLHNIKLTINYLRIERNIHNNP